MADERGVEGRRHGQGNDPVTLFPESFLEGGHSLCRAGQDDFLLRIQVRDPYSRIFVDLFPNRLHISDDRQHAPCIEPGFLRRRHRLAPCPSKGKEVLVAHGPGRPKGGQFAKAVPRDEIRFEAGFGQNLEQPGRKNADGRLGELRVSQAFFVDLPLTVIEGRPRKNRLG